MCYISPIVSYACNLGINILSFNAKFFLCNYCFVRRRENAKFFQALDVICTYLYLYVFYLHISPKKMACLCVFCATCLLNETSEYPQALFVRDVFQIN